MCVLGLGLIGGSVMRALQAAGREVFGYNRSIDGVEAARFDGFDATDDIDDGAGPRRRRAALIVLAVPGARPADHARAHPQLAPDCPLTDVISVKGAVLQVVQRPRPARPLRRRPSDGRHRALRLGGGQRRICSSARRG